jgi:hypothetical protein
MSVGYESIVFKVTSVARKLKLNIYSYDYNTHFLSILQKITVKTNFPHFALYNILSVEISENNPLELYITTK